MAKLFIFRCNSTLGLPNSYAKNMVISIPFSLQCIAFFNNKEEGWDRQTKIYIGSDEGFSNILMEFI